MQTKPFIRQLIITALIIVAGAANAGLVLSERSVSPWDDDTWDLMFERDGFEVIDEG